MEHTLRFSLLLFCILNFVCFSTQFGQVFVDQINPALTNETFFNSITSDNATVGALNVQTLSVSHPEGLIVEIPGSFNFGGKDHDLVGALGITLGSTSAQSVTLNAGDSLTSLSQVMGINADDASISSTGNMFFQSTRGVLFKSDYFNVDGLFGSYVASSQENVKITSGVEVSSHSEKIIIGANDQLFIQSQSGTVEIDSSQGVLATADSIFLQGLFGSQMVAEGNIIVNTEDLFLGYGAKSKVSSLTTTSFYSPQNVDFTSSATLLFVAGDSISVSANSELYISAHGGVASSVTLKSAADISLEVNDTSSFSAFAIHFDSVESTIVSSSLSVTSDERFSVGSSGTKSITIDSEFNNVLFALSSGAENDLSVNTYLTRFNSTGPAYVASNDEIKVVATNIKSQSNNLYFTSSTFFAYSLTANGRLVFESASGITLESDNQVNMYARDQVFIGSKSVATSVAGSISAFFNQNFKVSADNEISFIGGDLKIGGYDVRYDAQGDFYITSEDGDLTVSTVTGDISLVSTIGLTINAQDASFTSKRGDIDVNAIQSVLFSAIISSQFNSVDDLTVISYGDNFKINSASALNFQLDNPLATGGVASLVVGLDFSFSASSFTFNATDLLYSTGFMMNIASTDDVTLSSADLLFITTSHLPASGISFDASDTISFTANNDVTFESANKLTLSASKWSINTSTIDFTSPQSADFGAIGNIFIKSNTTKIASDGAVYVRAGDSASINAAIGDLTFTANDQFDLQSLSIKYLAQNGDVSFLGGEISTTVFGDIDGYSLTLEVDARNPGSLLSLDSQSTSYSDASFSLTSDSFYSSSTDSFTSTAGKTTTINSNELTLTARQFELSTGGSYNLTASSIDIETDKFLGDFTASSKQLSLSAGSEVAFTSEGSIDWQVNNGNISVTTPELKLAASNSEGFYSNKDINFLAVGGSNDIEILSNGGTTLHADHLIKINSDNDMLWKAQRSLIFRTDEDGIFLFAEDGNFLVQSAASILYEASDSVDMIAYNPAGNASANFISKLGMVLQSDRNGIYFKSEGFVPNSNDGIYIESKALQGDVIFHSEDGSIYIQSLGPVTFDTNAKNNLISADSATYTAGYDMNFDAPSGGFNFNANTGVTITAGHAGNPANLYVTQPKNFFALARSQLNIHSLGPLVGNAIEIVSDYGSIQFVTADASDIYLTATNDQTYTGARSYTVRSNEDIQAVTPSGPIIFQAQTRGQFLTEGGPIQLTTQTGSPGGNINILALSRDISFDSGNSVFFLAKQRYNLTALSDISFSSADGELAITADSASSVILADAQGYIQILSTGTRTTPYDGVYIEAANDVQMGTIATDTISFNSINSFVIGDISRPIVTINAGGSPTTAGVTINSDGAITAASENLVNFQITGELIYSGSSFMTTYSYGPSNIVSYGTGGLGEDITLTASLGAFRLEGNIVDVEAPLGIQATAAGNLNIYQYGNTRNNKILMKAPKVTFEDQGNFLWFADHVDSVLTHNYNLTTKGVGVIEGEEGSKSTMNFKANNQFTMTSGDLLSFTNQRSYGEINFETTTSGSPILIESGSQSAIDVTSDAGVYVTGITSSFTSGDRIIFAAQDAIPNLNQPKGDISFYTSGKINITDQGAASFGTTEDINIQTTGFDATGTGYPISFLASDELNLNAALDISLANTYHKGGSIQFQALSDLHIENSASNGLMGFNADGNFDYLVSRDFTFSSTDSFSANVAGDVSMTATGINSIDDYGIQFIADSYNEHVDFRSLFGDVEFVASKSITISTEVNTVSGGTSSLYILSKLDGLFYGKSDVTVDASDNVYSRAGAASTYFTAEDAMLFSTTQSSSSLIFNTTGVDDNGLFSMKFTSIDPNAVLQISSSQGPIQNNAAQTLVFQGDYVSMSTFKAIDIESHIGDILIESNLNTTFFSNGNINLVMNEELQFISSGTIYANSDGDISFSTSTAGKDISIRTTATDADVYMFSSGEISFSSTATFLARSAELPGSDVNVTSTLAHFDINAQNDNPGGKGVNLYVFSSYGPLTINCIPGDDGDFYIEQPYILDIHADGDIFLQSSLDVGDDPAVVLNFGNWIQHSESMYYFASEIDMQANTLFSITTGTSNGLGGSINLISSIDVEISADTEIDVNAYGIDADIRFISNQGDIIFYGGDVSLSSSSFMKVPYNNYPGTNDYSPSYQLGKCRIGEIFYISNVQVNRVITPTTSDGHMCYCKAPNTGLQCVPLREPPYNRKYPDI